MFKNPVLGPRIIPYGGTYLPSDRLPNGNLGFRVTAPFGSVDPLHPTPHTGMDIGNYACGDAVLAVADGWFYRMMDSSGAIGGRVQLPNGWKVDVWHLQGTDAIPGSLVTAGQRIGRIGATGFATGCHGHIEAIRPDGRQVDIWPLLYQNIPIEYRRLNGPGINMRNGGPWGKVYAYSTLQGILRAMDGVRLAPLNAAMRRGKAAKDANGDWWVQLWLNGAYRWVFAALTTKV